MVGSLPVFAGLAAVLLAGTHRSGPPAKAPAAVGATIAVLGSRWHRIHADRRIAHAVPDVLEIVALALGSGFDLAGTLETVREYGPSPTTALIDRTVADLRAGVPRRDALIALVENSAGAFGPMVEVLLAAEREGAPVAMVLDRLAVEATARRSAIAEERARRTPVLLLAPLVLCSLPAVLLGTIVPLVVLTLGRSPL